MTPGEAEAAIRRASEAKHVLEHPMVVAAINSMREQAYKNLEATKPSQTAEREFIYQRLKAVQSFEEQFTFHIEEGRMARGFLDEIRARRALERQRRSRR